MKRIVTISTVLLLAMALCAACRPQEVEKPPDEVTVQLAWTHHSLHAGFYAADQNGYYAEEGLAVNLMAGREVRMAELKGVIRKLRAQLEEAGLTPVADDPLLAGRED